MNPCIHYCLVQHANPILRRGVPASQVAAELLKIPEQCQHPGRCAHRAAGCRAHCAEYLRSLYRRASVREKALDKARTVR